MKVTALLRTVPPLAACGFLATLLCSPNAAMAQSFSVTNITVPGSVSLAVSAMNASGHVAGYCYTAASEQRAFHWADGVGLDLGTLGGSTSVGNSLNNFGQVAGYSSSVGDTEFRAFAGIGLTLFDLGTLGGPVSTASHICDAGHVTGYSFVSPFSVDARAFLIRNGAAMQDIGTLGGSASSGNAVNNAGEVIGDSTTTGDSENHAFLYTGGGLRDLGTLGGTYSTARDLNDAGQVTGESSLAGEAETHAFLFDGTILRDLGTLGGTYSTGYEINDAGQVIGDSQLAGNLEYHGFIYSNGTMTDLGTLGGGYSSAWGINNLGQVVGVSSNGNGQIRAFLWLEGILLDLNSLLPVNSGWELTAAYFINDNGQIVGTGRQQGQDAWYLLTPRAENQPPVAHAGPDQTVGSSLVTLDGSASSDPDGDALEYAWFEGTVALGSTALLNVSLAAGSHTLTLRVTDTHEASAEDTVVVNVVVVGDTTPPVVRCPENQSASADARGQAQLPDLLSNLVASDNVTEASALVKTQSPAPGTLVGCSTHRILITVTDTAGNTTTCEVGFNVSDTTAPTLRCLEDITRRARTTNCHALVPDLSRRSRARDNCTPVGQLRFTQEPAAGTPVGLGDHEIHLSVTDHAGNTARCTVRFHVVDLCPPRIRSLTADPRVLSPANHQMIPVTLTAAVTDNCDPNPDCRIVSVTSNEPVTEQNDQTAPDWQITDDLTLKLRAEVSGKRAARIYTIRVACTDASGNTAYRSVHVRAQRSQ